MLVTRFAPTPSGYLHVGNLVNLTLTHWLVHSHRGRLLLRIDDFDRDRVRTAYLADVFRTLEWLDIPIDSGPSGVADFQAGWSMSSHWQRFRAARDRLMTSAGSGVFVCRCSRAQLSGLGYCVAGCAEHRWELAPDQSVLRLSGAMVPAGSALPPGDPVLWRRDDYPAYHLGSVVQDDALGITSIVRGLDLLPSSLLQRHLATLLPAPTFAAADLRHHELVTDASGHKLSKSAGARAHPLEHTNLLRRQLHDWARRLGQPLGIERP